jgi:putative ABC transport system ATP-binding protein
MNTSPPTNAPVLSVQGLARRYGEVTVFNHVDLQLHAGEAVAIMGESGVGKSTLLNCIAGLDTPQAGALAVCGQSMSALDDTGRALLRRQRLGFVFQAFHVLPHLDVAQNVGLPLLLLGQFDATARAQRVQAMLERLGLADLGQRLPAQLSGGQLQRVAVARALVHRPALVLADEPTGNLDPLSADRVLSALLDQCRAEGAALVLVTHSTTAAAKAHRVLRLTATGIVAEGGPTA